MKAIGLDYETLAQRNPRIITCSISGFGSTGPLRDFPGFDQIAQGMSGLMSVTGTAESGPTRVGIAICDLLGGIFSAQWNPARARSAPSRRPRPAGRDLAARIDRQHPDLVGGNLFRDRQDARARPATIIRCRRRTASSKRRIARSTSHAATRRCGKSSSVVIGRPELAADERFTSSGRRIKNRAALTEEINRALASHPAEHWIQLLESRRHPRQARFSPSKKCSSIRKPRRARCC